MAASGNSSSLRAGYGQLTSLCFIVGLALFCGITLNGCHQRLTDIGTGEITQVLEGSVADTEQERFISTYGLELDDGKPVSNQIITCSVMRQLVLQSDPEVISARGELIAKIASEGSAGNWADPELDGRLIINDDGKGEIEGALQFAIPIGGRKRAAGSIAGIETRLARIAYDAACKKAIRDLDDDLIALSWAEEKLAVHSDLARRSTSLANLTRQRQAAAVADPLDVALIIADAAHDRRSVVQSRREVEEIKSLIRMKLALTPGEGDFERPPLTHPGPQLSLATITTATSHRDSWLTAEATYQLSEWEAIRCSRERIPDLILGPVVSAGEDETNFGISAGISLPIFSGGRSNYEAALARRDAAMAVLGAERRLMQAELITHLALFESISKELIELEGEPLSASEEAFTLAGERYEAGQIDILLLLSAHRSYSTLKLEILDLHRAEWQALLKLEKTVGLSLRTKKH